MSEPKDLIIGAKYILRMKENDNTFRSKYEDVIFLNYTSSPEIIVVKTRSSFGVVKRVKRSEIYEIADKEDDSKDQHPKEAQNGSEKFEK